MRKVLSLKKLRFKGGEVPSVYGENSLERIVFYCGKDKFTITPDFDGFRINKSAHDELGGTICINPGVANEIIVF